MLQDDTWQRKRFTSVCRGAVRLSCDVLPITCWSYEASIKAFCDVRRVAFEKMSLHDIPEAYDGRMCILRGKSPRGDFGHVVVARFVGSCDTSLHKMLLTDAGAFRLVHDPHPSSEFLDEGEACAWAMFFSEQN